MPLAAAVTSIIAGTSLIVAGRTFIIVKDSQFFIRIPYICTVNNLVT